MAVSKTKTKVLKLLQIISSKKASRPLAIDIRKLSSLYDYIIICSADNTRQVKAIYETLIKESYKENFSIHHSEEDTSFRWLLIDFYDVVVHIFLEEARQFYNLEFLWREGKILREKK